VLSHPHLASTASHNLEPSRIRQDAQKVELTSRAKRSRSFARGPQERTNMSHDWEGWEAEAQTRTKEKARRKS